MQRLRNRSEEILILTGGLGTRLGDLTKGMPKPMLRIHEKPFLESLIAKLKALAFTEIIMLVSYRADQIMEYFGDGKRWNVNIRYSVETQPMGTAGAIKSAEHLIKGTGEDFLILNGDSFLDYDYGKLIKFHRRTGSNFTMALTKVQYADRYGAVAINRRNQIIRFSEKDNHSGPQLINTGVYVVNKAVLSLIPADKPCSLEREIFPNLIGKRCYGLPVEGYFIDIGTPESYHKALKEFKTMEMQYD
jgi:NDP-sugar pyrophosphorylase family protein